MLLLLGWKSSVIFVCDVIAMRDVFENSSSNMEDGGQRMKSDCWQFSED